MATPWEDPIKNRGTLSVFAGASITGGAWATVFASAITEFNRLSKAGSFGVTLVTSSTPPDPQNSSGADVQFESGNGNVTFTSFGQKISVSINGKSTVGNTQQVKIVFGTTQKISKAFVVVPSTPQTDSTPQRLVGPGVMLFIAVHELIHVAGLSNSDHNSDDLFAGFPQLRTGSKPADDTVEVNNQKRMPPLSLTDKTNKLIQANWS